MPGQPHPFLPSEGAIFHGHYRVERCLRAGGMGAIYEATDTRTSEPRALKVLLPALVQDADMRERFALEATATVGLASPHLVEVLEAGVDDASKAPFFAMELLRGEDAGERLRRAGPLASGEVLAVMEQIADGLSATHEAGIVHRDLKPENVFFVELPGGAPLVKILDFGVAKIVASSTRSAHTTRSLGTPLYMAPEQIEGDARIDERADIYGLGQLVYTLLVGAPYLADEARGDAILPRLLRAMKGRREAATRRAARRGVALPPLFDGWFERSTAFSPARRFPSVRAQADALAAALRAEPAARRSLLWPGLALALLAVPALALRSASSPAAVEAAPSGSSLAPAAAPSFSSVPASSPGGAAASSGVSAASSAASSTPRAAPPGGKGSRAPARPRSDAYDPTDFR